MARAQIDDRAVRWVGIPAFGLGIPHLLGLFGPIHPGQGRYWLGLAWFVALSWIIWHGNRWLLFQQRARVDWFGQPRQKVLLLLLAIVFGTVPVTMAMIVAWYHLAGLPAVDWPAVRTVTLTNVICVVFVTHLYETVFLIKARESDLVEVERLRRSRAEAELDAWKAQVDPHFLFNALNTLGWLIDNDRPAAAAFNAALGRVYRYILASRGRSLVLLSDEVAFMDDYLSLLALRFGDAVRVSRHLPAALDRLLVPPIALQVLLENAVKHNQLDAADPLPVRLEVTGDAVTLWNVRRPLPDPRPAGTGLRNLAERYRLTTGHAIEITERPDTFAVRLPLVAA